MMRKGLLFTVLLVFAAAAAFAGTTGKLSGTVYDDQGQPLPGVTVTVASPSQIGGAKMAVTEINGSFDFPGLFPGVYSVKAELAGFVAQERTEVQVRLDRTTELSITMPPSKFGEQIAVTAETPVVDPTQISTSQTFTNDFLSNAAIGSANRGYQSVLTQAAGVAGGSNPNVYGSTSGENAYFVDGIDTTDPVTATFGTNFNFDAIQEISFQTGGFEAEYGRATGGVVNLVTKSGGNNFSGTLDIRYRSTSFYEDGDHFDRDLNRQKFVDPSVTLGGPIMRDKVWFFVSGEYIDSQRTPDGSPVTRAYEGKNYIGKITWQLNPNWRVVGKISGDPATIDNSDASRFRTAEANRTQEQGGDIYQAEVSGVLSPSLLWNLQLGINRQALDSYPVTGDLDTIGFYSYNGYYWNNYTNAQYSERDRDDYKTNMTWFVDDFAGSHEFKGGIEYSKSRFWSHNFTTGGGHIYRDRNTTGRQWLWYYYPDAGAAETTGGLSTAFLQDAWKVMPNLTIKVGVRYDEAAFDNDIGQEIASLDKLQPRVGFAWDITNDAKNVLRASWGYFMHPNALTLPNFAKIQAAPSYIFYNCAYLGLDPDTCSFYGEYYSGDPTLYTDPLGRSPEGWFRYYYTTGESGNQISDDLKATYADEIILSYERELFNRTSVEVSYVDKTTKDIFEDTCEGNLETPRTDACDFYIMGNLPELKRDYKAYIAKIESRATDWLHLLASYTWSESKGNVEYTQNAGSDFDVYPDHFDNRYGYLSDDVRHRVKLNGYVLLPWQFTVGFDAFWESEFNYNSTSPADAGWGSYFDVPRGSLRANDSYQLDLSVSKGLTLGPVNLQLIGVVYNVLDDERPTGVCGLTDGCSGGYALGDPTSHQTPRRYEAGFRIEF